MLQTEIIVLQIMLTIFHLNFLAPSPRRAQFNARLSYEEWLMLEHLIQLKRPVNS
jgi:hypothetical protein